MRASDADRERATDVLKAAVAEGRLLPEEYERRLEATLTSQTYGQLQQLVADLPVGPSFAPGPALTPARPEATGAWGSPGSSPVPYRRTNPLAAGALITGIIGFFTAGLGGLAAIVLGHMAIRDIRRSGDNGTGLAITGLVFGYLQAAFMMLIVLAIIASS